ncbi:dihydrolipoyllysine-residue succinyltransferase [Enterobacteriaceae endosymbiont of Donacia bicoloricornis]|uniref:dihydrolipoyllysine-residue succinyltransferase n=1 Tax=Enterobacteriaceae endosymbiont of Donacia bicoloricornis TaxID=2675772 RepID=UPI001449A09F|nr:dihydrolipoyllysine-residue succinyltransferase [Enterobacteriaceae endosymbiont of Donacia bicoloricornis]QJC37730.1 dihydrolipoyllysine-residue succinyltransferase [Enterobacteriaceae endosymbiont of Donacia bicoloricornis]
MDNINIIVPELPESINNAIIIQWYKKPGEKVKIDDVLLELETDKVVLEIPSTINGFLEKILVKEGEKVKSQQIIGILKKEKSLKDKEVINNNNIKISKVTNKDNDQKKILKTLNDFSPSIRRNIKKNYFSLNEINNINSKTNLNLKNFNNFKKKEEKFLKNNNFEKKEMSPIRKYISKKLMDSKNNTVMLTTFNEVNMKKIINIKNNYKNFILENYNIKLGFTSFHVKAVTQALQSFKKINAFIDGNNIIYNNFYNINIAIATKRGLITPIIYNTNTLSLIDIEKKIKKLVVKSNKNQLSTKDLVSGTFTITNGGVFGSLMSTPIINPPQSAILGMHVIKERPIVINHKIYIMPMMYLALSYDHRLIDGKEAIGFLMLIKTLLEDPIKLFL